QREDLAADVDGDLARQVAAGHGGGDLGDVAHLGGEVAGHRVDAVGQVLPGPGDAGHDRLAAELPLGAHLAPHAPDLGGDRSELVDDRVACRLEREDLTADVDGDLARQVAAGHGDGDLGDVAHLRGQVAGHRVDALGQVLPDAAHARNLRLPAQLAVGA